MQVNKFADMHPRERLLKAARELGLDATATEIANNAGFKNRKSVNYYFCSIKLLKKNVGFVVRTPKERLVEAAKDAGTGASGRKIANLAGYASHKIINLEFGSLNKLKLMAGTYASNKNDVKWSGVEFSPKDESIGVRIPNDIDETVAEETGIHVGDGCLPKMSNARQYRIEVGGHKIDEKRYYDEVVAALFKRAYNYHATPKEVSTKYAIIINSKALFTFKKNVIKLPIGNKDSIGIPEIIMNSPDDIKKAFVRGLADTDFSLVFSKKHKNKYYYPTITAMFSSKLLIEHLEMVLKELGFNPKTTFNVNHLNSRNKDKILTGHMIRVFGVGGLEKWVSEIGFHNPKHFTKYLIWKEFGHCPPRMTTPERESIIRGEKELCAM